MPRRARHEALHRRVERRRDIRRKQREARERRERLSIRYAFRHFGLRLSRLGTFVEEFWNAFVSELKRRFWRDIQRLHEEMEETREKLSLLRDIIEGRAKVVFKVYHERIFSWKRNVYVYDKLLLDLPPDVRDTLVNALIEVTRAKGVDPKLFDVLPALRHFLMLYIAYYSKFPCKHRIYAIKITPVTLRIMRGLRITYYVLRWAYARDVKADPYLGRTRPVDFTFGFLRYKYDDDLWNALLAAGEGTGDWNDRLALARDSLRNPEYLVNLRRAMLQPHWVKIALAKAMGKPEMVTTVGHCSVYGIVERRSKTLDLLETGQRRLMGQKPRHRIKEKLYYMGLRI